MKSLHPARPARVRTSTTRRAGAATVATVALLACGACSGTVDVSLGGSDGISGPALEQDLSDRVVELTDLAPASVDCPDGLTAEVGATTTCEMVHGGVRATLDVEATSVAEDEATLDFSWQVEPGSQSLLTEVVADTIADAFAAETGLVLTGVTCPASELDGTPGTVMTCEAETSGGRSGPVELQVRGAEGMRVDFSWRLADR
ncbi:hypothetical protein HMPREF0063_12213 [Aeromicrobium marinum DSM 15272]|uniref:DUF4333 domain-containing protein n=1 Tax=Aeromicrobium marinum DSM 15272 TaxID=585531 RepID=E2SCQ1_9ACTN|nr:DUF4333 domain-containing protein [Aeromicrobium marinum]EFQ83004.1 hypothetical protein HMPREF0063_12213 [Aeromicrobium marinum DSM 15272]